MRYWYAAWTARNGFGKASSRPSSIRWETQLAPVPAGLKHIPMGQVADRLSELDPKQETVVICRSGGRSLEVARFLAAHGFASVFNLTGGILAWSRDVDPTIPQY